MSSYVSMDTRPRHHDRNRYVTRLHAAPQDNRGTMRQPSAGLPWAQAAWHLVAGCKPVEGNRVCAMCAAPALVWTALRRGNYPRGLVKLNADDRPVWTGLTEPRIPSLSEPALLTYPHVIAVSPNSDLLTAPLWFQRSAFRVMTQTAHWHTYVLQTKYPEVLAERLAEMDQPARLWVGLSCHDQTTLETAITHLGLIAYKQSFIALKPLLEPVALPSNLPAVSRWLLVGGARGYWYEYTEPEIIDSAVQQGKRLGLPVYLDHYSSFNTRHNPSWPSEVPWHTCPAEWKPSAKRK